MDIGFYISKAIDSFKNCISYFALSLEYVIIWQDPYIHLFKAAITNSKSKCFKVDGCNQDFPNLGTPMILQAWMNLDIIDSIKGQNAIYYFTYCIAFSLESVFPCGVLLYSKFIANSLCTYYYIDPNENKRVSSCLWT